MINPNTYRMGECATSCMAHPLSPLAGVAYMDVGEGREQDAVALRIAAIAWLLRLIAPGQRQNGMHSTGRSTADSRIINPPNYQMRTLYL